MPARGIQGARPPSPPYRPAVARPRRVAIANHHPHLRLDRRTIIRVIHLLDRHAAAIAGRPPLRPAGRPAGVPPGELSIVFLDDATLARLHGDFLQDPSATDVITFPGETPPGLPPDAGVAGEICVSADAAIRRMGWPHRGRTSGRTPRRPANWSAGFSRELTLYLVHGWLHLAGHDDRVPARKRSMRRAEARAMALLRKEQCQPAFTLNFRATSAALPSPR